MAQRLKWIIISYWTHAVMPLRHYAFVPLCLYATAPLLHSIGHKSKKSYSGMKVLFKFA